MNCTFVSRVKSNNGTLLIYIPKEYAALKKVSEGDFAKIEITRISEEGL